MNNVYSMISLACKAGKIVTGEDAVRNAVRAGKVKLLILSGDASENTEKRFRNAAAFYHVECKVWGTKEQLGLCVGKSERSVVAITDQGFGDALRIRIDKNVDQKENPGGESFE